MKFIDEVSIHVAAGKGGSGCKSFRREKFVPMGGPDGGNGGSGGSVILQVDRNVLTLLDFRHRPNWKAEDGKPGAGSRKDGKSGEDLVIKVPLGTEVIDSASSELLCDLSEDGQTFIAAKGGRGGKGNDFFKSPTNRTPEQFQPGEAGEDREITLSLKLVADVGLIGLPNAGKSTLISRLSAARPKVADYPFTTLVPNLGVVQTSDKKSFVIADIPGLIPGAHTGKGLGTKFLKHIERTKVLVHLIDVNYTEGENLSENIFATFQQINNELELFSAELMKKPQLVAITKIDTLNDPDLIEQAVEDMKGRGFDCVAISSVSGSGIKELTDKLTLLVLNNR